MSWLKSRRRLSERACCDEPQGQQAREAATPPVGDEANRPRGVVFSELASLVAETWGCSRRNARLVVSDAHKEWMDVAFGAEDIDQRDLLFQQVARLERTARKAEESGQFALVVGCVAQLNKMMALGAD